MTLSVNTMGAGRKAPAIPEITNEAILLSLADENKRVLPISTNNIDFMPLEPGDGYMAKTRGITLAQLQASSDLTDRDGNLGNGINAYTLIGQVAQMAREIHADCTITDLFVADNKNRALGNGIAINKQLTEMYQAQHKTTAIPFKATTFNRVFCNIALNRYHTDTHVANIVVAYNQRGLQVGIGAHCHACRNQTILGASRLVSSYGNGDRTSMPVEEFMKAVRLMMQGYRFMDDMEALAKMAAIPIKQDEMSQIVGELTAMRVCCDSSVPQVRQLLTGQGSVYPLNQSQINRFMESLLLTATRKHGFLTLYDVYQSATMLYKVASMDMPNILPQNQSFVHFISERYDLGI